MGSSQPGGCLALLGALGCHQRCSQELPTVTHRTGPLPNLWLTGEHPGVHHVTLLCWNQQSCSQGWSRRVWEWFLKPDPPSPGSWNSKGGIHPFTVAVCDCSEQSLMCPGGRCGTGAPSMGWDTACLTFQIFLQGKGCGASPQARKCPQRCLEGD